MTRIESWDNPELNLELFFCTEVLKLDSLHYGYWEKEEKVNIESVRRAQKRYTETLLEMIPADVHTILDIGCGIGDNARAMAGSGYQVTAVSPDRVHAAYFKDADPAQIRFMNTSIENFASPEKYDLVLMSESQGYFAMDMGFSQSVRHLRPGGYLLVSGIFRQDEVKGFEGSHIESQYIHCAHQFNLHQQDYCDITDNTLPTLQFAFENYNNYLEPLTSAAQHFIGRKGQAKLNLLKTLFARELRNFEEVRRYYEQHFNPVLFKDSMRYSRILFQYQPDVFEQEMIVKRQEKETVSVIVSAYNEEQTVGEILKTLQACPSADEIIVVNDGSSDNTAAILRSFGETGKIKPIHFEQNRGKSRAMIAGALRAQGDLLVFLDGDLLELCNDHIQTLIQPLLEGKADMVIGTPQYSSNLAKMFDPFRPLSGERAVWRKDLLPLAEHIRGSGYGIETLLNMAYKENRKKIEQQKLVGLRHPTKLEKCHPIKAGGQYLQEGSQILSAVANRTSLKQRL